MARFCTKCGHQLEGDETFCTNCGAPVASDSGEAQATPAADHATTGGIEQTTAGIDKMVTDSDPTIVTVGQPAAQTAQTTVVVEQSTTVIDQVPQSPTTQPATQPLPASQDIFAQTYDQAPGAQAPVIQTPVIQTPDMSMQPLQPVKKSNTPLIIGIIVAVVVIVAALIVGFFVLGENKSSTPSNTSTATSNETTSNAKTTYKVTFETNGGSSVSAATVDQGGSLSTPSTPTRTDYTFEGWYLDSAFSKPATFPLKVEADMTLYAKWESAKSASDVTLSVVGRDGSTKTATIHRDGSTGRVFPDSNTQALTESQVRALTDAERCVAWNEIIAAANGYEFKNSGLKNYFNDYCAWYKPQAGSNGTSNLSSTANKNIEMLKRYTDSWWLNLATN